MKTRALFGGLLVLGVADWLVINLVVGPAYLAPSSPPTEAASPSETFSPSRVTSATASHRAPPSSPPSPAFGGAMLAEVGSTSTSPIPAPSASEARVPERSPEPELDRATPRAPDDPRPETRPITFVPQSAELGEEEHKDLKRIARFLMAHPDRTIVIEGHTDRRGADEFNNWLSRRRADAVRTFLHGLGVSRNQMKVVAHGSTRPVDTSGSAAGRARNRRVETRIE